MLTYEEVAALIEPDADGNLKWKVFRNNRAKAGAPINAKDKNGYTVARINRKQYLGHRIVWLLATGEWPKGDIDHIDGNPGNNRLDNLRDVSRSTNLQNQRKAHADNSTGFLGVTYRNREKCYLSRLYVKGRRYDLGQFPTPELAHAAYVEAKRQLHTGNVL